jgi:hypothetical protein
MWIVSPPATGNFSPVPVFILGGITSDEAICMTPADGVRAVSGRAAVTTEGAQAALETKFGDGGDNRLRPLFAFQGG